MNEFRLWYDKPASEWSQGLPLGNGRIGAVVYGGAERETWAMTEVTYWSGKPEAVESRGGGKEALSAMRERFFAGDYKEGDRLAKLSLQPEKPNFGTHLSLCDIRLTFPDAGTAGSFERELRLADAIARTAYMAGSNAFSREIFASRADGIVASRLAGESPGTVSFELAIIGRTDRFDVLAADGDTLTFRGQATETVHSDGSCGVWCGGAVKVAASGGSIRAADGRIVVTGADEAWVYFGAATDYRSGSDDWEEAGLRQVEAAAGKGYERLRADHIADYGPLYRRVSVALGETDKASLPTDERIRRMGSGDLNDPSLFALFFQYGRYLTIAGSRADSPLPLHLQGIWNDGEACRMGWSCDYHLDVNTEMNYYHAEAANLAECHLPLMRYLEDLAAAGKATAQSFYGSEGWVAHVFSNVWGFTAPGWDTSWGLNVTGGLWLATHLIRHYEYGLEREFLEEPAYPVLKEAAEFFLDYMTVHPAYGWLVTGPSNSPENHFYLPDRSQGAQQLSMGSTIDQSLVRELFAFCLKAAALLNVDDGLQERLRSAIALLPPLQIGSKGQLQEWLEDYEEAQPEHRHLSHLFALYPGGEISPDRTPELSAAARVTLENRRQQDGLEDIEFTAALFGLYFARLHEGDKALKHIGHLIGELCFDNLFTYSKAGIAGAETSIFVIDGNFGGTAAIAEMLLQSGEDEIRLLPALPAAWSSGSVTGLRAKGNLEVDMVWSEGRLTDASIRAYAGGTVTVRAGDHHTDVQLEAGRGCRLDGGLRVLAAESFAK